MGNDGNHGLDRFGSMVSVQRLIARSCCWSKWNRVRCGSRGGNQKSCLAKTTFWLPLLSLSGRVGNCPPITEAGAFAQIRALAVSAYQAVQHAAAENSDSALTQKMIFSLAQLTITCLLATIGVGTSIEVSPFVDIIQTEVPNGTPFGDSSVRDEAFRRSRFRRRTS